MNVNNDNRGNGVKTEDDVKTEDSVKTEDGEIIDNVHHRYIGDEYKNLIVNIFKFGLKDGNLYLKDMTRKKELLAFQMKLEILCLIFILTVGLFLSFLKNINLKD